MTTPAKQSFELPEVAPVTLQRVITELRLLRTSERLLALYELGLEGCANHDPARVIAIGHELIASLDYEYADIAEGFRSVYEYCLQQAADGQLDGVAFVFQDLRDTLMRALTDTGIDGDLGSPAK